MPSLSWLRQKNLFDNYGMGDYMPGEMGNAPYQNLFKESQPTPPNPFGSIDFGAPQDFASQIPDLTDPSPTEQAPTSPQLDLFQKMNELYKPTTTATDRFNKLLDSAPTMDDNPSWQRKLVADRKSVV